MTAVLPDVEELPGYQVHFAGIRQSRYAVLIPVINEGERILRQLAGMKEAGLGLDVLVVDGGSTDRSMDPQRLKDALGVHALLVKTGAGRLSAQLRVGMSWALLQGYDGVITIDGNGKDDYRAIPSFARALDEGFDHIQGSRYISGGLEENTPWERSLGVRLLHAPVISLAARYRYTDTTNGFRGYSRRLLLHPGVRPFRRIFATYNLHYYLAIRAARLGLRVRELPVTRRYPPKGKTPSKIQGLSGKLHILKQLFLAAAGAYDPR